MYVAIPLLIYLGERTIRAIRAGNYEVKVVKVRLDPQLTAQASAGGRAYSVVVFE
jgi:hypothetical protein